jgi:hypothetical protein
MDRRDFFKSLLITPLITPLFLASKTSAADSELYLLSDSPQVFLPPLLEELDGLGIVSGRAYSVLPAGTQSAGLSRALDAAGWKKADPAARTQMSLFTSRLHTPASPSFTLAREGRVWDLRSRGLLSLWKNMNSGEASTQMTVASFKNSPEKLKTGQSVSIFKDGSKVQSLSLKKNSTHSFPTANGRVEVRVEEGRAWVSDSSCRQKICASCPPASLSGERIICAPNHFLLEVDGASSFDTIIG